MEFTLTVRFYNGMGGHPTLSWIPTFLIAGLPDCGPALREIEMYFCIPPSSNPLPNAEGMNSRYASFREALPYLEYRRSREFAAVSVRSEVLEQEGWKYNEPPSLTLFTAGLHEAIAALELLAVRFKSKDNFRFQEFLAHARSAPSRLPGSQAEFAQLIREYRIQDERRRSQMDDWDQLDIEWRDFHHRAREILDNPFYWDCVDDFAPHGNDTGADLLDIYQCWHKKSPSGDPLKFFRKLLRRWGIPEEPASEIEVSTHDEAAVALAFAELKLKGACAPEVRSLALEAIERQRQQTPNSAAGEPRNERQQALDRLESKLTSS